MIGLAFGTRPEWIKIKPVCQELAQENIPFKIIFTGQHKDLVSQDNLKQMGAQSVVSISLKESEGKVNRLDNITTNILLENSFTTGLSAILVQGDTTSAFSAALASFHRGLPVIHLEAGLRTYDVTQPFPEEANRQMISSLASLHLCPTELSKENLIKENRHLQAKVSVTGNTALDNLRGVQVLNKKNVLVTMHRRENQKDMKKWFFNINSLAVAHPEYRFLLPIHPNPNVSKHRGLLSSVDVVEPMSHRALIQYLASCEYVITDSGGIQEESSFFRKPCIVCREETERKEGLENFSTLCRSPDMIPSAFAKARSLPMTGPSPYGDGYASRRVVEELKILLGEFNDRKRL